MAWNRPTESGETVSRPLQKRSGDRIPLKGAMIAGVVVALVAAVAVWCLWPSEETRHDTASTKKDSRIREVTPAAAPKTVVEDKTEGGRWKFEDGRRLPKNAYKDEHGVWRHPGGARVFDEIAAKDARPSATTRDIPIFSHDVDTEIATLLTVEPGTPLLGTPNYEKLRRDFANAIVDKIEISEDESERDREIKQQVIDAKKELVARVKNGEDAIEILKETREELQRLSQYHKDLRELVSTQVRDFENVSDQDAEDALAAANKMLEEKGAAPISKNVLFRRKFRLMKQRRKQK